MSVDDAVELFRESVVPALHEQPGYEGVYVLVSPEGQALVLTFWGTEEAAEACILGARSFYSEQVGKFVTIYAAPPGRETYEVVLAEEPATVISGVDMKELSGIPMDTLAAVLAALFAIVAGSLGALAGATASCSSSESATSGAAARVRPDRSRAHAGDDHHRRRARDGRHDEPHHPCDRYPPVRRHRGVVAAKGAADDIAGELGAATGTGYFPESTVAKVQRAFACKHLTDGVTGVILDDVALQAPLDVRPSRASRSTRPIQRAWAAFAPDPPRGAAAPSRSTSYSAARPT